MVKNKIERISLMGGLAGLMLTNPRKALDKCIDQNNRDGWRSTFIVPHAERNILVIVLQLIALIATVGIWTWSAGYLVMFEKGD